MRQNDSDHNNPQTLVHKELGASPSFWLLLWLKPQNLLTPFVFTVWHLAVREAQNQKCYLKPHIKSRYLGQWNWKKIIMTSCTLKSQLLRDVRIALEVILKYQHPKPQRQCSNPVPRGSLLYTVENRKRDKASMLFFSISICNSTPEL